jgi:hypothetical protein
MISSQPLIHCWQSNTSWFTGRLEALLLTDSELVRADDIGSIIGCVLQLQLLLMQPAVGRTCNPRP